MGTVEAVRITSSDGTVLEGEIAAAESAFAAVALCHPHPQYGGSMRAGVISDLFRALPAHGVTTLRFNFRGVERSEGAWDEGRREQDDVTAAVDALAATVPPALPLHLVGWSFGADMALSVRHGRVASWCAIAPPLRFVADLDAVGADPRPKHVVLGALDDVVDADRITAIATTWRSTTVATIAGATHFFVGRSAEVVAAVHGVCTSAADPAD